MKSETQGMGNDCKDPKCPRRRHGSLHTTARGSERAGDINTEVAMRCAKPFSPDATSSGIICFSRECEGPF